MGALYLMVEVEMVTCPHNSPLDIEGEAIDIDHRVTKQQYTTHFHLFRTWVVERPAEWHANKKPVFIKYLCDSWANFYCCNCPNVRI